MHRAITGAGRDPDVSGFALHGDDAGEQVLGRLVARGLHDELKGSAYAIVEGLDGRTHHLRFSDLEMTGDARPGAIVEARAYDDPGGRKRLSLATRSDLPLDAQVIAQGATWIDRQLLAREPAASSAGFGAAVRDAVNQRVEHLSSEGLARRQGQRIVFARDLLDTLRRRELEAAGRVLSLIEGFMPEAAWLSDTNTLTYLHSCVSTRRQRVRVPETPMHLDAILVDEDLTGGLEPRLGRAYLRTLTIMGFPSQTWPGLLDELNRLAFPYRWSTRAICLDKTDATKVLGRIRRQWFAKRKSIMAILKEVMTNEASVLMDSDAANKALDADVALQELGSDLVG